MITIPFYPDKIPVVFASDNKYVPFMSAAIQSIVENSSQNREYIFFIFHKEIKNDTMELIIKQISPYNQFSIEFINVSDYIGRFDLFISRHVTIETYFRFLIPELLCEYQKVIYLDCDMIICADIAELFDISMDNYIIAAMRDITVANWFYASRLKKNTAGFRNSFPKLKNPSDYFVAGLLVFNIPLFRKTISQEELFEVAISNEWDWHDQDVLNIIAEGKVFLLSFHWGVYIPDNIDYLPENLKNEFYAAEKNPKIIHFVIKPWKFDFYIQHFEHFWKYATRTPFINTITNTMDIPKIHSYKGRILLNISQRKLGFKFIFFDCIKALFFRNKKNKILSGKSAF